MFSQGFASGLMSIREESPGRTGRFQGFAEPLPGNVLRKAACPAGQGLRRRSKGEGGGEMPRKALHAVSRLILHPCYVNCV